MNDALFRRRFGLRHEIHPDHPIRVYLEILNWFYRSGEVRLKRYLQGRPRPSRQIHRVWIEKWNERIYWLHDYHDAVLAEGRRNGISPLELSHALHEARQAVYDFTDWVSKNAPYGRSAVPPPLEKVKETYDSHVEPTFRRRIRVIRDLLYCLESNEQPDSPQQQVHIPTIIFHDEKLYSIANWDPIEVSDPEDTLLQAFLEKNSMTSSTLRSKTGYSSDLARKTLNRLRKKYDSRFAPAIHMPGKKGNGGYLVRIIRNPHPPVSLSSIVQNAP